MLEALGLYWNNEAEGTPPKKVTHPPDDQWMVGMINNTPNRNLSKTTITIITIITNAM